VVRAVTGQGVAKPDLRIEVTVSGGTIDLSSGLTDTTGVFRARVRPASGSSQVSVHVVARASPTGGILLDRTVQAQVPTGTCGEVLVPTGTISVTTTADLAALANVREITGGAGAFLQIEESPDPLVPSLTEVSLPCLTRIGSLSLNSRRLKTLNLPNLVQTDGPVLADGLAFQRGAGLQDLVSINLQSLQVVGGPMVIRAAQALSDVRIGPMRMLAPLTLSGLPSLRNLDGFNSGMNVLVFQFGQVGFSEADGLALANRITVRGAVCNLDANRCYPGPPWRP
jgi:hypothetical protein